jgi:EAL domain-containing protein (putative c-di-GMP-specific phosphodiesterase class I)
MKLNTQETILNFEKSSEIIEFDLFVLQNVVKEIKQNPTEEVFSVNISAKTLRVTEQVVSIIKDVAEHIILEITETANISISEAAWFAQKVKQVGAKVAIDDINHSNHPYGLINAVRPNIVKFVLPKQGQPIEKFTTLISYVRDDFPNIQIVVENIENFEQASYVKFLAPNALMQGFFFNQGEEFIKNLRFK